jgi:hypothetical protein
MVLRRGRCTVRKVRLLITAAIAAGCLAAFAPTASAGEFCYSLHVQAQGGDVVNQSGCIPLP